MRNPVGKALETRRLLPVLTPSQREWFAFFGFAVFVLFVDRISNAYQAVSSFNSIVYVVAVLCVGSWAGFRPAFAACAFLICYVWTIYRFPWLSAVVKVPSAINKATIASAILFPPFALVGGLVHASVRRATARELEARADARREAELRHHAQAELWASEEMRRLIVDSSAEAVVGIAPDRRITLWSPNAERLFGWSRSEALGRPAAERVIAPVPEQGDTDVVTLLGSEHPPIIRQQIESTAQTKSGGQVAVELYIADYPTESGTMYMLFAHDISQRKQSELMIRELNANLRELNSSLEVRVAERTRQLEAANQELLGFSHSVSHDLRTPLRGIISNSRIVCVEAGESLDADLRARLQRVEANARKMSQLIEGLLEYARIGQTALSVTDVDLSAMAGRIASELVSMRQGSIAIEPGIIVIGDPGMIETVISNLLENAWKYVAPGESPQVEMGTTDDGLVFVRDHGVGFDMRYVDKIFEPFERLHKDSEFPGTGIGLANSKRIVTRHGGRIWPESEPGKGTTMYFDFGAPVRARTTSRPSSRARAC